MKWNCFVWHKLNHLNQLYGNNNNHRDLLELLELVTQKVAENTMHIIKELIEYYLDYYLFTWWSFRNWTLVLWLVDFLENLSFQTFLSSLNYKLQLLSTFTTEYWLSAPPQIKNNYKTPIAINTFWKTISLPHIQDIWNSTVSYFVVWCVKYEVKTAFWIIAFQLAIRMHRSLSQNWINAFALMKDRNATSNDKIIKQTQKILHNYITVYPPLFSYTFFFKFHCLFILLYFMFCVWVSWCTTVFFPFVNPQKNDKKI